MEKGRILGGRYKIDENIGSGGMSTVYRAHEIGLEREVAVKVLLASLSVDQQLVERFNREAKTIASLQHNSIIPIYYYGFEDDFGSYLVMPLLTGGTLDQRLEQLSIRPSITEVGEMAEKLGSALQYAHDRGIIHRDIKFSNIMFDEAGSAYLTDFGIAKILNATNLTGTGMTVGTPQFMPPEQWRNDEITPAVDQYALAVLLYAMLTQRMPFDAPTPHGLMYQHLQEEPPLASTVRSDAPIEIEDALHKALSKDPADRYESVTAFTNVIADASRKTKREYSGFFQAPITKEDNTKTVIGDTPQLIANPNKLPNTPTEVIASPMLGKGDTTIESGGGAQTKAPVSKTEKSGGGAQTKPPTQMVGEMETITIDRRAFWGGIVTALLVGVIGLGSWFFIMQNEGISATETAVFESTDSASQTETQVAIVLAQATDTPTTEPTSEPTHTPSITATVSDTATATPDTTGTERANQQATESAAIRETGTALAEESTQQANDHATATESAFIALAVEEATASTATALAETREVQTAIANQTATADRQNATATQNSVDEASTATAEVERLNQTATAVVETSTALVAFANNTSTAQANMANNTATAEAVDATGTAQVEARDATSTAETQYREGTATALAEIQAEALTAQASFDATATQLAIVPTPEAGIEMNVGVAIEGNVNGERRLVYFFEGEQNQVITISARSADFDTVLELFLGTDDIAGNDDGGYRLNSRIADVRLPSDGIYTIVLTAFAGELMDGDFSLGITEDVTCPGLMPSRLYVGELARVTLDDGQNRLRAGTTREAVVVDAIPEGGVFEVLAGPVCDDIFTWYQVRWDDRIGWTAEGNPEEYWLERLPEDDEPIVAIGGEGLTTGATLAPGEFQVEYYCSRRGLTTSTDTVDWFCDNSDGDTSFTLGQDDFDQICEDTYGIEDIFALQEGDADEPAYQWQCFYYPE